MNHQGTVRGRGGRGGQPNRGRGRGNVPTNPATVVVRRPGDTRPKVKATDNNQLVYTADQRFPKREAFSLIVVDATRAHTITYHHPIGISDLGEDEWVATPADQIHYLFDRAIRPDQKRVDEQRRIGLLDYMVELGLLTGEYPDYRYAGVAEATPRRILVQTARRAADEAAQRLGQTALADAYVAHLAAELVAREYAVRAALNSDANRTVVEGRFPYQPYETRYGELADRRQIPIAPLRGMQLAQAKDTLTRVLYGLPPYEEHPQYGEIGGPHQFDEVPSDTDEGGAEAPPAEQVPGPQIADPAQENQASSVDGA